MKKPTMKELEAEAAKLRKRVKDLQQDLGLPEDTEDKPCECELCQESKMMHSIVVSLPQHQARWLTEFYEKHMTISFDANYDAAVLDGSWPTAVEQLTVALTKAKEIRARYNKENKK